MKNSILLFILICMSNYAHDVELTVTGAQQKCMPITLFVIGNEPYLMEIAQTIQRDLLFTQQFSVQVQQHSASPSKKELRHAIHALFSHNVPLALCINASSSDSVEWRIYETAHVNLVDGKKCKIQKQMITRAVAHTIADEVWMTLTGNKAFFSSRIAYCTEHRNKKGVLLKKIYVADCDGSNRELLVNSNTVVVTPRWYSDVNHAVLFFSEYTNKNVRLVATNMAQQQRVISNFDGTNMMPCFSSDGKAVIYSASHGTGHCQLYYYENNKLRQCTNNTGNNFSPSFIDQDHICFCSDAFSGRPQIYILEFPTQRLTAITKSGYCTSPTYSAACDSIFYHRMVHGVMQICRYNCATKQHVQITKSGGNKHEVSCSPCGTQLLFAHEYAPKKSRIENVNLLTYITTPVSPAHELCSYPHWSPCYSVFPTKT